MHAALEFILELILGIWRFRRTAMLVAWIACVLGWLVVLALPDIYSAWTRVYIDTHTRIVQVTKDIGVEPNVAERAEIVREALLGGPQLEEVARRAIPRYAAASPREKRSIVEGLSKRLLVETNGGGSRNQPADLYTITYTDSDRRAAHAVVKELLQLFVSGSIARTREEAEQAQEFLRQRIAEQARKLQADEARVADFKRKNAGLLPGATGDYITRLAAEKDKLESLSLKLQLAEQKPKELQRQLAGEAVALGSRVPGGIGDTNTAPDIAKWETNLRDLRLRYTDKHPDVVEAQRTLEELNAVQKAATDALKRGEPAAIAATCDGPSSLHPEVCRQLIQANVEVATARAEVEDQKAKLVELNKLLDTAPQVEAQYAQLTRDYEETGAEYRALMDRLNHVKLSDQVAAVVVPFKVIQPPTGGDTPVSPDRPRLILMVLLGGLVAGLAVAYFMHQLRPVFISARQLGEVTQLPMLGVVSMTWMERYKGQERRAMWAYSVATAVLVLVAVIVLLVQSPASQFFHGRIA